MIRFAGRRMLYILPLTFVMCIRALARPQGRPNGFDLFVSTRKAWGILEDCNDTAWQRFDSNLDVERPKPEEGSLKLHWTHNPQPNDLEQDGFLEVFTTIRSFVRLNSLAMNMGGYTARDNDCESTREVCVPQYYCLHDTLRFLGWTQDLGSLLKSAFLKCLQGFRFTPEDFHRSTFGCTIWLWDQSYMRSCGNSEWDLTQDNWNSRRTDGQLEIGLRGGLDSVGTYWPTLSANYTLSEKFTKQFWNVDLKCTLADPCQHVPDCNSVGSFYANPMGFLPRPYPSYWVYYATSPFVNINQQLRNQYEEVKDAIESLALDTFSIDDFFPTKSQDFSLFNSLTGLSGIFSILGGFVPVAGPFITAAGTIASGVGTFLQNSAASSSGDPLEAQKIFSQKVLTFYRASLKAMDDLVAKLFKGEPIPAPGPGSFTLLDMMKGGAWVNSSTLTDVSDLIDKIRGEILARSIDSLWKSRTQEQTIKMWVLFTDLSEDPDSKECVANSTFSTGPPGSKYCADGGVYYTYNFWEQKGEGGGVGWPYGADKLKSNAGIELKWVTEASAKSYRAMKASGQDPFNFNQTSGTTQFLATAFTGGERTPDLSEYAGRFPGSWTLPVCDASTWGKKWNWDYTGEKNDIRESVDTHPPC